MKALITGASSGIGRDMARYLSSKGYSLILVARNDIKMMELKNELKTDVKIIASDLSIKENALKVYELTKGENIDFLINDAGFGIFGNFEETDIEKEINLINTNVIALHILTKLFLKDMKRKNSGYILNVSSMASFSPGPLMAAYYASKAYVTSLTRGISRELKESKSNVKISCLCPGPVDTNFNNVANVKFSIKPMTSEYVAKYAVDKTLEGKELIIPGTRNKILHVISKLTPSRISSKVVYKNQTKKV